MNTKILNIFFFARDERLTITVKYVGCKQSLGGVIPENLCDMQNLQMLR